MRPLKRKNLSFMKNNKKTILGLAFLLVFGFAQAQEMDGVQAIQPDSSSTTKVKLDGIASVIGDYVILESDIDKTLIDLRNQGASTEDITRCSLLGKLMEDRLYAHQAVQDSLLVSDEQVNATSDRQIQELVAREGSMEKVLRFYKAPDIETFRAELSEINKLRMLSEKMQTQIVEKIEVTPEEVRQFFYNIPEEERPIFGAELEIAQIVKQPEAPEEEKQKVIDQLKEIKQDVEENGASFNVKAILYSQDPGSQARGGLYSMTKETQFIKEFKDVAFRLREGEISEPVKTDFG